MKRVLPALSLCLLLCSALKSVDDRPTLAGLQYRIAQLESALERAEAIRSVKRLQQAYGHYAEYGMWNDLADLFADRGIGYYLPGNITREDIRKHYLRDIGKGKLGLPEGMIYPHIILQPVITLDPDGKTAKGRWRVFSLLGVFGETAIWAGGIYENEYTLENGIWKIKDLYYFSQYSGRYDQPGWTIDQEFIPMHYDPRRAGAPAPTLNHAAKEPARSLPSLNAELNLLLARAQRLNDQSDVENLQHIYGYYVDRKMWDDVADLFAPDGSMELAQQGVYVGRPSIRRALEQFGPAGLKDGELNDHLQLQTIVDVSPDGMSAKARGTELIMSGKHGAGGDWGEGVFENTYAKQNGVWRIKSMHIYQRLAADYDKGWARDAKPAAGPNKKFPPDRPPTKVYAAYPRFFIPPFHYNNPVTSRPPQYPESPIALRPQKKPRTVVIGRTTEAHSIPELQKKVEELDRLLKRAVAYDASENIVDAYGYYTDYSMWDEAADLFTRDGSKELPYVGTYVGRERIRQSLKLRSAGGYFTVHQITQPVIHVSEDGQSAKVRIRLLQLGGISGGNGSWLGGIYENKTALEDGIWKITALDLDPVFTAGARGGWAHAAGAFEPQKTPMSSAFAPDRPLRGAAVAPFPKIMELPFHYLNPASGRRPPLYLP